MTSLVFTNIYFACFSSKIYKFVSNLKNHQFFKLPSSFSENVVVRRFLNSMNAEIEEAKKLIVHSYTMRTKYPNLFYNRDPLDEKIRQIHNVV